MFEARHWTAVIFLPDEASGGLLTELLAFLQLGSNALRKRQAACFGLDSPVLHGSDENGSTAGPDSQPAILARNRPPSAYLEGLSIFPWNMGFPFWNSPHAP